MRFNDYDFITQASQLFQPEAKKKEWYEEIEDEVCALCPKLTWQQRIGGCIAMMSIGFLLSLGSLFRLLQLLKGNPAPFAIMYTIGNIISISSTCFLFGLQTQYKSMCASSRIITTSIYFFFMGLCLFLAFFPGDIPVRVLWLFIAILGQFLALVWYTISFIPYARDVVSTCLKSTCRSCGCGSCQSVSPPVASNEEWF